MLVVVEVLYVEFVEVVCYEEMVVFFFVVLEERVVDFGVCVVVVIELQIWW